MQFNPDGQTGVSKDAKLNGLTNYNSMMAREAGSKQRPFKTAVAPGATARLVLFGLAQAFDFR